MKKILLATVLFTLLLSLKSFSQNITGESFVVKNPNNYPYGIGVQVDYTTRFAREFNITHTNGTNLFSIGAVGENSKLAYGYIGGGANGNANHNTPWMTFLPNGNTGIGTKTPQYLLDVNGGFRTTGASIFQDDIILKTGTQDLTPFGTYGKRLYFGNQSADNGDYIWMARYNVEANRSDLRVNIGDDLKRGGDDRFVVGNIAWNAEGVWKDWFVVNNDGKVGIQVSNPQYPLDVNGTIHAKEVLIDTNFPLADYVFKPDYKLMPLNELEQFVQTNSHLPEIPSAKEVEEKGLSIGEMQNKLLQKIEELTLYMIEQNKKIEQQNKEIESLKSLINK